MPIEKWGDKWGCLLRLLPHDAHAVMFLPISLPTIPYHSCGYEARQSFRQRVDRASYMGCARPKRGPFCTLHAPGAREAVVHPMLRPSEEKAAYAEQSHADALALHAECKREAP